MCRPGGTNITLPSWTSIKAAVKANNWTLSMLSCPDAGLSGPIGPLAFYFPQLVALDLSHNQLTGVVPWDLGQGAAKLQHLLLNNNMLRGAGGWL